MTTTWQSGAPRLSARSRIAAAWLIAACLSGSAAGQEPPAPQAIAPAQLQSAIDTLGNLDYTLRSNASRTVRRTPGAQAVPALLRAVQEHADGYVRYRALVLLTGFNDPRTRDAMIESLASPNDRLRTVAYQFFERNPDRQLAPRLLDALDAEGAEFVRPALIRALAAVSDVPAIRPVLVRETARGEDFFRSVVIEALGDYKASYAVDALIEIAGQDGPLVDDAALALGKIGDRRGLAVLAELQRSGPKSAQPFVSAGLCLLGVNCEQREAFLMETLKFADRNTGFQDSLRAAAGGLGALGVAGRRTAVDTLFDVGIDSRDPTRAPISLAVATIALRNTPLMLEWLAPSSRRAQAITLIAEGFDMLEEDLEKERFFATVRRAYWAAAEGSPERDLMRSLITQLDF